MIGWVLEFLWLDHIMVYLLSLGGCIATAFSIYLINVDIIDLVIIPEAWF